MKKTGRQEKIKKLVEEEVDYLEDVINSNLRETLEHELKDVTVDDIAYARKIFFRG